MMQDQSLRLEILLAALACCWLGPLGAVRPLERPSWLMAPPSSNAASGVSQSAGAEAGRELMPSVTHASPRTYLRAPKKTANFSCAAERQIRCRHTNVQNTVRCNMALEQVQSRVNNRRSLDVTLRTFKAQLLPASPPVCRRIQGLAAAVGRQHGGSGEHADGGWVQREQRCKGGREGRAQTTRRSRLFSTC